MYSANSCCLCSVAGPASAHTVTVLLTPLLGCRQGHSCSLLGRTQHTGLPPHNPNSINCVFLAVMSSHVCSRRMRMHAKSLLYSTFQSFETAGAPWSTQAVVEWMVSVQLELLRSGKSKRMTEQLSQKAIDTVASADSVDLNGNGISHDNDVRGPGRGQLVKEGTSSEH